MSDHINLDFETYSEAGYLWDENKNTWTTPIGLSKKGIKGVGLANYALHPSTEIVSMAYDCNDGTGVKLWIPQNGEEFPEQLKCLIEKKTPIHAWNSAFEFWIWEHVGVVKYGFPNVPLSQFVCTAAMARAYSLPPNLKNCGLVLNITKQKDKKGERLIQLLSVPKKPTKKDPNTRRTHASNPKEFYEFYDYNKRDVEAESEIGTRVPMLSDEEKRFWDLDQEINYAGICIDREALNNCISLINQAYLKYNPMLSEITNGYVKKASEVAKIVSWLRVQGIQVQSLDDDVLESLLTSKIPDYVRKVLKIRQYLSSAAVKKLYSIKYQMTELNRVHNLFVYYGTRTGRASGSGPQPQNLPSRGSELVKCPDCQEVSKMDLTSPCPFCNKHTLRTPFNWSFTVVEKALEHAKSQDLEQFENYYGDVLGTVSGCIRSLFIASPGHDLIGADYHSIEAVVLAALAHENWRLDVFRTHGKIYDMSAAKITGQTFDINTTSPARKLGKIAELASGYGGGINAWKKAGAGEFLTDTEIKNAVSIWRKENSQIVEFWGGQEKHGKARFFGLEGCAILAIMHPKKTFNHLSISFQYDLDRDVLLCTLPSGRNLYYHRPRLAKSTRFESWGGNDLLELSFEGWNTNPKVGKIDWIRMVTYGGKLAENVTQAVSRDIMLPAFINLKNLGYKVVLHVHDEVVGEVVENKGSIEEFERTMEILPIWAKGWPISASGGWRGKRYRKT